MNKPTPTPWESSQLRAYTIQGPDGDYILQVYCGTREGSKALALANERFIVRAVNVHEDLIEAAEHFRDCKAHQTGWVDCPGCEKAEQAIAKAEGRQ